MGISFKTGRQLSWLACLLLVCFGPGAKSASADELSNSETSELVISLGLFAASIRVFSIAECPADLHQLQVRSL
jgi:hypothetical protein